MNRHKFTLFALLIIFLLLDLKAYGQILFETGQSFSTAGSAFEVVAIGDVNNDGRKDIVAATGSSLSPRDSFQLVIYYQSKQGTFPSTSYFSYSRVYLGINSIAISDVNNDSLNDIVIGFGDSISIFFQNNLRTINPGISYFSGASVDDIKIGDVNQDSLLDIVVCHWNDNFIRIFYQSMNGFTAKIYPKPSGGFDEIEIGDLNSDGLNDVVFMAGQGLGGIHVFIQNENGSLNNYVSYYPNSSNFNSCQGIVIADLNGDGANDIAGTIGGNRPDASLLIWYQDTITKKLKKAISIPAYEIPRNIYVDDFDCDGRPELVMNHGGWDAITVWTQNASGNYINYDRYQVSVAQHPKPEALVTDDINSDGKSDIVTIGNFITLQVLYNISTPTTFTKIDTSVEVDTISIQDNNFMFYFTSTKTDTLSDILVIHKDSFKVSNIDEQIQVRIDSIYSRTGIICSSIYNDVIIDTTYSLILNQGRDTLLWSSTIDTVQYSDIYEPNILESKIYPIPFSSQLNFLISDNYKTTISLYNNWGQLILYQTFNNSITLPTVDIANGIYFFELRNEKGKYKNGKIVKHF